MNAGTVWSGLSNLIFFKLETETRVNTNLASTTGVDRIPVEDLIARTTTGETYSMPVAQPPVLTIKDLGWTEEKAAEVRGLFSAFAEDWDDPSMDAYNVYFVP